MKHFGGVLLIAVLTVALTACSWRQADREAAPESSTRPDLDREYSLSPSHTHDRSGCASRNPLVR